MTEPTIDAVRHAAPSRDPRRILLVALPGYGMERDDFARHGFIDAVHARGWPVDIIAARPDVGLYLDGAVAARLHAEIILPARPAAGCLWLLGVSLGAMGALLYARQHPGAAAGAIVLAPFLGTPGLIAEVAEAGGLARWDPGEIRAVDVERRLLSWLRPRRAGAAGGLPLYLGYGRADRFARAASLLAQELPAERVILADGGHDWETWRRLWLQTLDRDPFAVAARAAAQGRG
jgi:pimeloyl-ACP methyl ester carboxylesterase